VENGGQQSDEAFISLEHLREQHLALLEQQPSEQWDSQFQQQVQRFITQTQASGVFFGQQIERRAAQSMIDFWIAARYRVNIDSPFTVLAPFDPARTPPLADQPCPYVGLAPFDEAQATIFFGRQRLVEQLLNRLTDYPLLVVVGSSGSGKSSLVRAGLLPRLRASTTAEQVFLIFRPIVPGAQPLAALEQMLKFAVDVLPEERRAAAEAVLNQEVAQLRSDPTTLGRIIAQLSPAQPAIIVVDQLEELFLICPDEVERQAFVDNLLELITPAGAGHRVVLIIRNDYEDNLDKLERLPERMAEARFQMQSLGPEELRRVIEEPARRVGLRFEEGIVDDLIQQIRGEASALPLLQFTLWLLWEHKQQSWVTRRAYEQLGGPRRALNNWANRWYEQLTIEDQEIARRVLLRLLRPGDQPGDMEQSLANLGFEATSYRTRLASLYRVDKDQIRVERVVNGLLKAKLLRQTEGTSPQDAVIELAHESLVRNWPLLRDWIAEDRVRLREQIALIDAARLWLNNNRDPSYLWSGQRLTAAQVLPPTGDEHSEAFIEAGLAAEYALQQAQQQTVLREAQAKRRVRGAFLTTALIVFFAVVLFAWQANQQAAQNGRQARSRELAAAAELTLPVDPVRSLLLSQAAVDATSLYNEPPTSEAYYALEHAVGSSRARRIVTTGPRGLQELAVSPDGSLLATVGNDGMLRLFERTTIHEQVAFSTNDQQLQAKGLVFSSDGTSLLTGVGPQVQSWNVSAKSLDFILELPAASELAVNEVQQLAISPDGLLLAVVYDQGILGVWDIVNRQLRYTLAGDTSFTAVTFSPDSLQLVSGDEDGTLLMMQADDGSEISRMEGHQDGITDVVFNAAGTTIASSSFDVTIRLWDATTGDQFDVLRGHTSTIYTLQFSADDRSLASASEDNSIRIWSIVDNRLLLLLTGHTMGVSEAVFSRDGSSLYSAGLDGTIRQWDLGFMAPDGAYALAFSPDGSILASAGIEGLRLWDSITGVLQQTIPFSEEVATLAYSPKGDQIAAAVYSGYIHIIDLQEGSVVAEWEAHSEHINQLAYSPDGTILASAGEDGQAKLWQVATRQELKTFSAEGSPLTALAFSPNGSLLAVGDYTGMIHIIPLNEQAAPRSFLIQENEIIQGLDFSPDSSMVAVGNYAGALVLLDVQQMAAHQQIMLDNAVNDLSFNSPGDMLAVGGQGNQVRLYTASNLALQRTIPQSDAVYNLAFNPVRPILATATANGQIQLVPLNLESLLALAKERTIRGPSPSECLLYQLTDSCDWQENEIKRP
jgi:WD40 repeat protein